ncbi:hypothetical protein PP175_05400 [Aneurinibacillus sp. Ricciae_BoGa-3]|uniref:hypothetical protein n=1 Tax=Aneurinibacillus sp. Ricciae_BoGa-3 TaxID=3022697 RepID=UPI0023406431|nr:hypothetical protein [Aneurinibacillus sp. Ricciae_BoGa-3]WCK55388.1 hypothetical protein PP175_05400 [Aneurinibacillus sp. Ricciae_BoGa-3]
MKTTEQRIAELEARVAELEKAAEQTTADNNNPLCVCCKDKPGDYELHATDWICDDCAQYMNDAGNELDT